MKLDRKSKIFIVVFFSIILIPVFVIGTINYTKEQELKNRIESSKNSRTLVLNSISTTISLEELFEIETSKEYLIEESVSVDDEEIKWVTYTNNSIYGAKCEMDYTFYDDKLARCIFTIDTSHWMPKNIYEELVKLNGEPDETEIDDDSFYLETYTWYGKNGTITYNKLNNDTIEVFFDILN